jgi:DNA modification methylase
MAKFSLIVDQPSATTYERSLVRDTVIHGDAIDVLPRLPSDIYDLIFLDPPYFLQLPPKELIRWSRRGGVIDGVSDRWDRFDSFGDYDAFIEKILTQCRRVLKPTGTLWVISTYHSLFRIGRIMQDLGYWLLNDVMTWVKTDPMPNWLGVRFTNATETLIWAARDKDATGYTFHRDCAKEFGIGKVAANVWVIPLCKGPERLKDDAGEKLHSTQKPFELLRRVLLTTTNEDDLILDPLAGTGTTAHAAALLNRRFTAIERNADYVQGIVRRLDQPAPRDKTPTMDYAEHYLLDKTNAADDGNVDR